MSVQKCTTAIRMLAYGVTDHTVDDYMQIGEPTTYDCLLRVMQGVNVLFGDSYLI